MISPCVGSRQSGNNRLLGFFCTVKLSCSQIRSSKYSSLSLHFLYFNIVVLENGEFVCCWKLRGTIRYIEVILSQ